LKKYLFSFRIYLVIIVSDEVWYTSFCRQRSSVVQSAAAKGKHPIPYSFNNRFTAKPLPSSLTNEELFTYEE